MCPFFKDHEHVLCSFSYPSSQIYFIEKPKGTRKEGENPKLLQPYPSQEMYG
jgi:hypothetical protein